MGVQTARRLVSVDHGRGPGRRSDTGDMRVNGEPERWLVAARLSKMSKRDRARGNELINGIQTQDRRSTDWAQQEGHVIAHVTRDRNISGAIPPWERAELGPWLTDPVKLVQYDGIVAYDVQRLSRGGNFDVSWLRKWAEQNHKKLYVIKERLRWPDRRDGMLWAVEAERAEQERLDIIERVTRELNALRDAGKLTGRPAFGYASAGEKYDHYLVPTDGGRKYVPLIFQYCIDGWSMDRIAKWLKAEGVAGIWWPRNVSILIRNPVYKGHRCKREYVPADEVEERDGKIIRYRYGTRWAETPRWVFGETIHRCEPLVDAAIWKRANDALTARPSRGYTDPENRAMLAEALFCPYCEDSPMYRNRAADRGSSYSYYRCTGRGSERRSCGNMVRVQLVDQAVNEIMAATFNVPVIRNEIIHGNEAEIEAEIERINFELKQLSARGLGWEDEDRERAALRAQITTLTDPEQTPIVEDHVEPVETDDTYLELWEGLSDPERGPWLISQGFRVTASKDEVTVSQSDRSAAVPLAEPEKRAPVRDTTPVLFGKCGCGCGADVYGSKYGMPKKFVNGSHARAYSRRRQAESASSPAA